MPTKTLYDSKEVEEEDENWIEGYTIEDDDSVSIIEKPSQEEEENWIEGYTIVDDLENIFDKPNQEEKENWIEGYTIVDDSEDEAEKQKNNLPNSKVTITSSVLSTNGDAKDQNTSQTKPPKFEIIWIVDSGVEFLPEDENDCQNTINGYHSDSETCYRDLKKSSDVQYQPRK